MRGREGEELEEQLGAGGPPENLSDEELPLDPRLYQELCAGAFDEHGLVGNSNTPPHKKDPPPKPQNGGGKGWGGRVGATNCKGMAAKGRRMSPKGCKLGGGL